MPANSSQEGIITAVKEKTCAQLSIFHISQHKKYEVGCRLIYASGLEIYQDFLFFEGMNLFMTEQIEKL